MLNKLYKVAVLATAFTLGSIQSALASSNLIMNPETGALLTFSNGCDGRSDFPHISSHVPGTVNVEALTECPGKKVTVSTTLPRKLWWFIDESVTLTKSSFAQVKVNVSMKCKWKLGEKPIKYIVQSIHSDSNGEFGRTR